MGCEWGKTSFCLLPPPSNTEHECVARAQEEVKEVAGFTPGREAPGSEGTETGVAPPGGPPPSVSFGGASSEGGGEVASRMVAKGVSSWCSGRAGGGGGQEALSRSSGCPFLDLEGGTWRAEPEK